MKEKLDTLVALAGSLSGQSKDLKERAVRIEQEEENLRRSIAAERARPLRIGSAIARRVRDFDSMDLRVAVVTGFHLSSNPDPMAASVYVNTKYAEGAMYDKFQVRDYSFNLSDGGFIFIDPKEARELLGSPLFPVASEEPDDE